MIDRRALFLLCPWASSVLLGGCSTGGGHLELALPDAESTGDPSPDAGEPGADTDLLGVDASAFVPAFDGATQSTYCQGVGPVGDEDGDGFREDEGDCNDCSPQINPGAFDVPGNELDEDCDGTLATDEDTRCDDGLALDSLAGEDAARARAVLVRHGGRGRPALGSALCAPHHARRSRCHR